VERVIVVEVGWGPEPSGMKQCNEMDKNDQKPNEGCKTGGRLKREKAAKKTPRKRDGLKGVVGDRCNLAGVEKACRQKTVPLMGVGGPLKQRTHKPTTWERKT